MTEEQVKNFIEDKGETGLEKKLEEYKKNWKEKGQTPQKKRRRGVLVHSLALPHHYGGFTLWFCYINP